MVFVSLTLIIMVSNMNAKTSPFFQVLFTAETILKKGRKNLRIVESDLDIEVVEVPPTMKTKIVYDDTKVITGAELELK